MNIHKILVPIVFVDISRRAVKQAAYLSRHFHAEIILLHVVTPEDYPAGMFERGHEITARDLHAEIVRAAQKNLDQAFLSDLEGISVKRVLLRGHAAHEIVETARSFVSRARYTSPMPPLPSCDVISYEPSCVPTVMDKRRGGYRHAGIQRLRLDLADSQHRREHGANYSGHCGNRLYKSCRRENCARFGFSKIHQ